jgi:hypothetical protein
MVIDIHFFILILLFRYPWVDLLVLSFRYPYVRVSRLYFVLNKSHCSCFVSSSSYKGGSLPHLVEWVELMTYLLKGKRYYWVTRANGR